MLSGGVIELPGSDILRLIMPATSRKAVQHKSHGRRRPEMLDISGWCIYQALGKPEKVAE